MRPVLNLLTMTFLLLCAVKIQAQTPVTFGYDADGNLNSRSLVIAKATAKSLNMPDSIVEPEVFEADSVIDKADEQTITIYPNPTSGTIVVAISPLDKRVQNVLRLYDVSGRLLTTLRIQTDRTTLPIEGPAGMYLLNLTLGEKRSNWKIIKQ